MLVVVSLLLRASEECVYRISPPDIIKRIKKHEDQFFHVLDPFSHRVRPFLHVLGTREGPRGLKLVYVSVIVSFWLLSLLLTAFLPLACTRFSRVLSMYPSLLFI